MAEPGRKRPRNFADDWSAPGSPVPPTTLANPAADIQPGLGPLAPRAIGERYRRLDVGDLVGTPGVDYFWGGLDVSPDGREVAFAWDRTGHDEVFVVPIVGTRIYQLTASEQRSVWPRWAPDGATIAFLRDQDGDERFAIWLVDRDGKRERTLTAEAEAAHRDIAWSPDGTRLACVVSRGRSFGIEVVEVGTGSRTAVTDGTFDDANPRWSPDGRWLAFQSHRDERAKADFDVFVVEATGGTPTRLDTRAGGHGESFDARWSPDGTAIAFTTNARGRYEIALAELDGTSVRRVRVLTGSAHDSTQPFWRGDGRGVIYLRGRDSQLSVRRVFAVSHADSPLDDTPGVHAVARPFGVGESIVSVFSSGTSPWDVWVREEGSVEPRALTSSLPPRVDAATLVEPVHVRYAAKDGRSIPALLYVPYAEAVRGDGPPPAVVYVHGGPTGQHFVWWDPACQLFANRGYVVLAPNVRGSTGYGREFQEANRGDWGGADLGDVVAGVEWLEREHIADGKHVGIYGGSYGGFMTTLALALHPTRFAAGVSGVGVVSWKTLFDTTRGDGREYFLREFGDPETDAELYRDRSPLTHAAKIRAPLLILQGANDPRVPQSEAEQVVAALKKSGTTFDYHVYPDEGHGFTKTQNLVDSLRRAAEWFDRHLTRD